MKKRYSEIIKSSQDIETKYLNIERDHDDLKRKESRARRDNEEYTEQIKKYK